MGNLNNWLKIYEHQMCVFVCQACVCVLVAKSFLTLWPMHCSPPGSSVHGILQTRIMECVAISFSRGSSWPRDQTQVSWIAGRFFTIWATGQMSTCNNVQYLLSFIQFSSVPQSCPTLCDPWTVVFYAPLSMAFSKQEYWSGLPFPSSEDLPKPGTDLWSPELQADSLPSELPGKPYNYF